MGNLKVGFSFDPIAKEEATDGKSQFIIRLAKEMQRRGIVIDNKKPDVFVRLPGEKINKKASLNILRVDGLIMNTRWDYKSKNKKIVQSIKMSDALIYQGIFCEEAYRKFLNITNVPFAIIPNGADPSDFLPRNPQNFFLANSKWRPHKRLKDTVKCFTKALKMGIDADLIVTGNPKKKYTHPRIKYVGWQHRKKLTELLSLSLASLHLTWLDWCPNSMVEAIVAGCPVLYTKSGGQTKLGRYSGIGVKDKQWRFNPVDLYSPPKLDREEVAAAMLFLKENKGKQLYERREELYIKQVSEKYVLFFKKLLGDK